MHERQELLAVRRGVDGDEARREISQTRVARSSCQSRDGFYWQMTSGYLNYTCPAQMPLPAGHRFGPCEVISILGAGGPPSLAGCASASFGAATEALARTCL